MMSFWKCSSRGPRLDQGGTARGWSRTGAGSPSRSPRRWWPQGVEGLERRALLATSGVDYALSGFHWANPAHITFSIAPDGVNWDHGVNGLNAALDAGLGAGVWERQAVKALATWEAVANINIVQVPDGPYDFNYPGSSQGDARTGDIRLGGYHFAGDATTLAQTYFPPPNGSTAAGDVAVNTGMDFNVGSDYDLFSVLLHETGHSLGLDHAPNPDSVMYATYQGVRSGLGPGDVAGVQAVYGPRTPDIYQRQGRGVSAGTAIDVSAGLAAHAQVTLTKLSLATVGDTEYFTFVAPAGASGGLSVTAAAAGISLLSPKVTLLDAWRNPIDSASNPAAWGDNVVAHASGVTPGQRYYAAVTGATGDVFSVGAYAMRVTFTTSSAVTSPSHPVPAPAAVAAAPPAAPASPATPPAITPAGSNTSMASARPLGPVTRTVIPDFSFDAANDPEYFVFQTTHAGDYWVGASRANVRVLDASGRTLSEGPDLVALPVATAQTTLYVEVTPAGSTRQPHHALAIVSFAFGAGPSYHLNQGAFAREQIPTPPAASAPVVLTDPSEATGHNWARAWALGRSPWF